MIQIYKQPYGNLWITIWTKWPGKASHKAPIERPIFFVSQFQKLQICGYQFIGGPMETYRSPHGPNGRRRLFKGTSKEAYTCA